MLAGGGAIASLHVKYEGCQNGNLKSMCDEGALLESPQSNMEVFSEDSSTNLKYISVSCAQIERWGWNVKMDLKRGSSKLGEAVPSPL